MLTKPVVARAAVGVVSAILVMGGTGCPGPVNEPAPPTGETVSFSADVQPIFNAHCTTCHRAGGFADLSGIALRLVEGISYDLLVDQPSSQRADLTFVVPGNSAASLLFLKVSSDSPPVGSTMPLTGARLSSSDLGLIRDWIDQGALDN